MKHIKGDLLRLFKSGQFHVMVHGANCFNTMGSGIALQIRNQFPEAVAADQETTAGDHTKIGDYTFAEIQQDNGGLGVIVNAYTQYDFNRTGESQDLFEYEGFRNILAKLAYDFGGVDYGFPLIGMGLAGGSAEAILGLLQEFSDHVEGLGGSVTIVEWDR